MTYFQFNDPLIFQFRTGKFDDPYVSKSDSRVITNGSIVLEELPDKSNHVIISEFSELSDSNAVGTPSPSQFIVDYANGIVRFNPSQNGTTVVAEYMGRGNILFPASRIYTHNTNTSVTDNLQTILDNADASINIISNANTAINNVNTTNSSIAAAEATRVTNETARIGRDISYQLLEAYNASHSYVTLNKVTYNGSTYQCILATTGNIPTNTTYWIQIAAQGSQGIQGANGNDGVAGTQGIQGIQGIQGLKGSQWRGAYNGATAYVIDDVVSYLGSSYINILASTGNLPTNATYFSPVALKGTDGAGSGTITSLISTDSSIAITGTASTPDLSVLTSSGVKIVSSLTTATSSDRGKYYLLTGAIGVAEVSSLTITAGCASNNNITVTLNGVNFIVALTTASNTATLVATAIRATTFIGWTTGGSGTTVTFTCNLLGSRVDATYSGGTTGATGTMTTTTQGVDSIADKLFLCLKLAGDTYDWVQVK